MMTFFLFRFLIVLFLGFTFSSSVIEGNLLDSLNSLIESEDAFVDGISLTSGDAAAGSSSGGSTLDETPSEETLVIGSQTDDSDLHSNCHILPAEIHVTKEDMDETGNVRRTCEGNIIVSKCEGTCRSELRPSVSSPTGLHKASIRHQGGDIIFLFFFFSLLMNSDFLHYR